MSHSESGTPAESEVLVPSDARHYRELLPVNYDDFDDWCGSTTEVFTTTAI